MTTPIRTFDELNAFDGFVDIGQVHSVQIINGWLAEMTGPNSAVLTRDDNQLALRTFALPADFTDAARELRAAVKRFEAVPKGAHLSSLELNSEGGYPDAYAGLVGTWRGKPAHVAVELSIREGHALLTSLWLTDGLGSRAFREGYQMMVGAIG